MKNDLNRLDSNIGKWGEEGGGGVGRGRATQSDKTNHSKLYDFTIIGYKKKHFAKSL